jgi:MraZ protein
MKFQGNEQAVVDGNGRVSFPASFRKLVPSEMEFYISPGVGHTLNLRTRNDYELWAGTLQELEKTKENFELRRKILHNTHKVVLDESQKRFPIPPKLREYAGIEKDVVFSGNGDVVVMSNVENAAQYTLDKNDDFSGAEWIL